ncbi:hypothetical protein AVEN_66856-1 [Araneus ventricosus]|uniref:Transposase Tc1-like domain-containing protein n=1 Tax=Araneus ventricosus TaxID=182803 RepID=A0A4Y2M0B3_ARAVE|nr:hypothetical protein AVEN_103242-1 [Araneus ventricosus]GBN20465.1 hypothetical protein AVEN_250482-1 [Araneus ventricosus]GBN20485.1 hypothetical protein AVEN_60793-1 [Araneus ventricosus]GBN20488.1 hypothetical protein AVEN_66856-1 [Araneus ventricosus]
MNLSTQVLVGMARSPTKVTRCLSAQMGIRQSSVMRILLANMWHPYKLQMLQHLTKDDPDRRAEFCKWTLNKHANVPGQKLVIATVIVCRHGRETCGTYPVIVTSYDTTCKNKINISHCFHREDL